MALFVGLDVSLRTTSICVVEANGSAVWEGKAESELALLIKALIGWRSDIALIGIEACPLSEWLYGALVDSGFRTVCIETRHAQRFLSSRPNKTDRSDARGIAEMMRLGHFRPVHVKSRASQLLRTTLIARRRWAAYELQAALLRSDRGTEFELAAKNAWAYSRFSREAVNQFFGRRPLCPHPHRGPECRIIVIVGRGDRLVVIQFHPEARTSP
jgi:hypothetical protein